MHSRLRFALRACFTVMAFFVGQTSALAVCTSLGGNYAGSGYMPWDNATNFYLSISQSGTTLTVFYNDDCGTMNIDTTRTRTIDSSGNIEFWTINVCDNNNRNNMISGLVRWYASGWNESGCDEVTLNWQAWASPNGPPNTPSNSGSSTFRTYPEGEVSETAVGTPWVEYVYAWKARATGSGGRKFVGRRFFELDNTPPGGSDNCWITGMAESLKYISLNGGSPQPPWDNPSNLLADANGDAYWTDYVGRLNALVVYYRQNSGIDPGSCSSTVGQRVAMYAWDTGTGLYRSYKDNTHVLTVWDSTLAFYNVNSTDHWTAPSQRDNATRNKMWPVLEPPTSVSVTAVSTSSVSLTWSGASGDLNEYDVWRRVGGTGTQVEFVGGTSHTDTAGLSANTHYYYCIRAARADTALVYGTTMHTFGPCPGTETHGSTFAQPTSLSASPATLNRATSDCYVATFGNAANMTVHVRYSFGGSEGVDSPWSLNGSGQITHCTNPGTPTGTYTFTGIRNVDNTENGVGPWVTVNVPVVVQ